MADASPTSAAGDDIAGDDIAGDDIAGDDIAGDDIAGGRVHDVRDLGEIPAVEVISRAAVLLMSAAAEKLGLAPDGGAALDLDEARRLISGLAGLLAATSGDLGPHRAPLRDGLRTLQQAFREASPYPDEPGQGPGEQLLS